MAPALLTRREAAEIGRVPLGAIDKAIEQGVLRPRRAAGKPLFLAHEVGLLVLLRQIEVQLPLRAKRRLRAWLADRGAEAVGSEFELSTALRVAMTEDVARAIERADEYVRLRDRYIKRDPAIMGGEPVIRGTRIPVRTVAGLIEQGESREVMREDFPQVPEEAYAVAVLWTHANPRRGRPARPWDVSRASGAAQQRRSAAS
jgi:uncharacterized protein (DUF433 family)